MHCGKCGESINIKWNFCPECGKKVSKYAFLSTFDKICDDVLDEVSRNGFSRKVKNVIEPRSNIKINDEGRVYEIYLPNVDSKNINVRRVGESLEIRAFRDNVLYFKILQAPIDSFITKKRFSNDKLSLRIKTK